MERHAQTKKANPRRGAKKGMKRLQKVKKKQADKKISNGRWEKKEATAKKKRF